jgi:hypothetical protein
MLRDHEFRLDRRFTLQNTRCAARTAVTSLVCIFVLTRPAVGQSLQIDFGGRGLRSTSFDGVPLLKSGQPRLRRVVWADTGETFIVPGNSQPRETYEERARRVEQTWEVGRLSCVYRPQAKRLNLELAFTNTTQRPMRFLEFEALHLAFPATPTGLGWYRDLHCTSDAVDDVAAVIAQYGKGTVAAVGEALDGEFRLALYKDFERTEHGYRLLVSTINRTSKDFIHADPPGLKPSETLTFHVSLRFGSETAGLADLAGAEFARFAERFPRVLRWPDRRPIAMLMLANQAHRSSTNPRGWLNDASIEVTTPTGREVFRNRLLAWADRSIGECRKCDAQGAIVWDVEGEEFGPLVYVGDPRMLPELAPEFDAAADEFFKKFTDAGLKTGVCIRPSRIARRKSSKDAMSTGWRHGHMAFDPVKEMADKIAYAKRRWGCSLYYFDSNVTYAFDGREREIAGSTPESWVMRAELMRRLAQLHPDVLIIPEFQSTGYYSHLSGYKELRGGIAGTPPRVLLAYPQAFSVINVADGKLAERHSDLVAAVRRGDILMFRGWFAAPENRSIESIYREAHSQATSLSPASAK